MDATGREIRQGMLPGDGRLRVGELKQGFYLVLVGDTSFGRFVKR